MSSQMFNHMLSYNYIRGVPKKDYDKEPTKNSILLLNCSMSFQVFKIKQFITDKICYNYRKITTFYFPKYDISHISISS